MRTGGTERSRGEPDLWRFGRRRVGAAADADEVVAETFAVASRRRDQRDKDVTVDIWVADGLIRRIDISAPDFGTQSAEIYDIGADITITPPPGPYADVPELSTDG